MYEANYEALANAIILQAVRDFKPAYRRLKNHPNDRLAQDTVREITSPGDHQVLLFTVF